MSTKNESRSRLSTLCIERDQEQQAWDEDGALRNRELDAAKRFRADYQKASQSMFSPDVDWSDVRSGVELAKVYENKWREAEEAHTAEMTRLNTEISTVCTTLVSELDGPNHPSPGLGRGRRPCLRA